VAERVEAVEALAPAVGLLFAVGVGDSLFEGGRPVA
jgi:hypothetical protein